MRTKYKLGQFIVFTKNATETNGTIDAIIQRTHGVSYGVGEDEVKELDILQAYKPVIVVKRKKSAVPPKSAKQKKYAPENEATN